MQNRQELQTKEVEDKVITTAQRRPDFVVVLKDEI